MKTILFVCLFCIGINSTAQSVITNWPRVSSVTITTSAQNIILKWTADKEDADLYYEIERSTDGEHFKTAAIVLTGFSDKENFRYQFKEKNQGNKVYYRIKQIKQNGSWHIAAETTL
ncbi:hypothetical protein PDL71_13005 [Lacibacter sp. MH-610]|uniref:hypothetical protein n=1 Tax=Lacibacter sp. MH-610 TaxID=3020883 RepID=UPI0038921B6F